MLTFLIEKRFNKFLHCYDFPILIMYFHFRSFSTDLFCSCSILRIGLCIYLDVSSYFRPVGAPTGIIFRVYYKFSINLC